VHLPPGIGARNARAQCGIRFGQICEAFFTIRKSHSEILGTYSGYCSYDV
jgi:hypothetical protein